MDRRDVDITSYGSVAKVPGIAPALADNPECDAGVRATDEGRPRGLGGLSSLMVWVKHAAIVALLLLVAADVAVRSMSAMPRSSIGGDANRRWVPRGDILNATDPSDELRFVRDVGNHGLQGLALSPDGDVLFEVHTLAARTLRLDHASGAVEGVLRRRVWSGPVDFPPLLRAGTEEIHVAHIGGVDICTSSEFGTELWLATHSEGIDGAGGLFAADPATLDILPNRGVLSDRNLDWVACRNGILYFGEFFNVRAVQRAALDTLERLDDLPIDFLPFDDAHGQGYVEGGIDYVQSAAFDDKGRIVLLGDDYQNTIYTLDVEDDHASLRSTQGLLLGGETDGMTLDRGRGRMLVGYNREHSHEQVVGIDPMISIVELVRQ